MPKQPMQPTVLDDDGDPKFKQNAIVRYLLDNGPFDMNHLGNCLFSTEDREQFLQLIGYSVCGFGEAPYVSKKMVARADKKAAKLK